MIKIGDRVKFINDVHVGIVKSIRNAIANVEVEDGFVVPAVISELVAVDEEEERRAVERIGVGDERPGTKGKAAKKEQKEEKTKRVSAFSRYGKVALLSEDEEEEESIDLNAIREQYLRQVVALNNKDLEKEAERKNMDSSEDTEPVAERSDTVPEVHKMHKVELDELGTALGVPVEKVPIRPDAVKKSGTKNGHGEPEVVDLHIEKILEDTEGMSPGEILTAQLSRFTIALDSAVLSGKHGKMVFIHGVGSGKLKYELQKKLKRDYPKLSYQDASFREYGYGAILIFY